MAISVTSAESISAVDAAEWDAVVAAAGAPAFYSSTFLAAYEREPLSAVDAVRYLLARDGGRLVAAVPLYLMARPDPLGKLRPGYPVADGDAALLSASWHCYDGTLVAAGGPGPEVVTAVLAGMRAEAERLGARWYGFVNVARDTATSAALTAAGVPRRHLEDRFATDLSGLSDLDGYLARLAPRYRQNVRRRRRRADDAGLELTVGTTGDIDVAEAAALCRSTAGGFDNSAFYPAGVFERFLTLLAPVTLVIEARHRGRLIGVCICLLDAGRLHTWIGGYDHDGAGSNVSPYTVVFAEAVSIALRLHRPVLEGGRRNPDYKLRHGLVPRPLDACLLAA
jgi:predicted N-acyltransferase